MQCPNFTSTYSLEVFSKHCEISRSLFATSSWHWPGQWWWRCLLLGWCSHRPSPDPEQNSKFYLEITGWIEDRRVVLYRVGATGQECMQHGLDNWMINISCFLTLTSLVPFEMLEFWPFWSLNTEQNAMTTINFAEHLLFWSLAPTLEHLIHADVKTRH